jgi:hypothetical protein
VLADALDLPNAIKCPQTQIKEDLHLVRFLSWVLGTQLYASLAMVRSQAGHSAHGHTFEGA